MLNVRNVEGWRSRLSEPQQAERIRTGAYLAVVWECAPQPQRNAMRNVPVRAGGDVSRQAFEDE